MRTLISGAHGNQHSPELTTPTQWKDSALARSQNSPQNASASWYMHIAAFTYHPTTTHHASILTFLLKKKKVDESYLQSKIHYRSEYRSLQNESHYVPRSSPTFDPGLTPYGTSGNWRENKDCENVQLISTI